MHGFLDVLVVAGGGKRNAVLNEIELAVGFGDDKFAVRRIGVGYDVLARILQAEREAVQVGQQGYGDQAKAQQHSERGEQEGGEPRPSDFEPRPSNSPA